MNVGCYFGSFPGSVLIILYSETPHMRKKGSKDQRAPWDEEARESGAGEGGEPQHQ